MSVASHVPVRRGRPFISKAWVVGHRFQRVDRKERCDLDLWKDYKLWKEVLRTQIMLI